MKTPTTSLTICVLLLAAVVLGRGQTIPTAFSRLLDANSLRYAIPPGFTSTPVITNRDVEYDCAVRSKTKKLEIRYRIWPLKQSDQAANSDINSIHQAMLLTMALNISNGQQGPTQAYPSNSVREEFGADAGSTTMISCNSDFGKGFQKCLISVIHKDNVADAYVFFLFDDLKVVTQALMTDEIYHALRFR
jgi:hypothetical protein